MLSSAIINAYVTDNIKKVVIEDPSQWVIGRNFTANCIIINSDRNSLKISDELKILFQTLDLHKCMSSSLFMCNYGSYCYNFRAKVLYATEIINESKEQKTWSDLEKIIVEDNKYLIRHASLRIMKNHLQRNKVWYPEVENTVCRQSFIIKRTSQNKPGKYL